MSFGLSKNVLQTLADARIAEASALYEAERWSGSYYLAGYAIEFSLKACIAKMITSNVIPDREFINRTFTHSPLQLVGHAGLSAELKKQQQMDAEFHANWGVVSQWNVESRYEVTDRSSAQLLLNAIVEQHHGVLPWIKTFW